MRSASLTISVNRDNSVESFLDKVDEEYEETATKKKKRMIHWARLAIQGGKDVKSRSKRFIASKPIGIPRSKFW